MPGYSSRGLYRGRSRRPFRGSVKKTKKRVSSKPKTLHFAEFSGTVRIAAANETEARKMILGVIKKMERALKSNNLGALIHTISNPKSATAKAPRVRTRKLPPSLIQPELN